MNLNKLNVVLIVQFLEVLLIRIAIINSEIDLKWCHIQLFHSQSYRAFCKESWGLCTNEAWLKWLFQKTFYEEEEE